MGSVKAALDGAFVIDGVLQLDLPHSDGAAAAGMLSSFVAGPENALVVPAIQRLLQVDDLEEATFLFNPLVLVGPPGSGKSQLVQGLARRWRGRLSPRHVEYFTAADFGRQRQAAADEERLARWQTHIRGLRLLVVEDIQRLRRRDTIQQELRHAIDAITENGGSVVVTAEREPGAFTHLEAGLRDRLEGGLIVRLKRPNLAARRAILQLAAYARGVDISENELARLSQREVSSAAELLGRFSSSRSSAGSHAAGGEPGLGAMTPSPSPSPQGGGEQSAQDERSHLKQIIAVTARYFTVTQAALTGPSRRTSLVEARNVAVHLARRLTSLSYAEIGRGLGGRDHTTIMHADRRLGERLAHDPLTQQAVNELDRLLR